MTSRPGQRAPHRRGLPLALLPLARLSLALLPLALLGAGPGGPAPFTTPVAAAAARPTAEPVVPRVTVEPAEVAVGDRLTVRLTGWPPGSVLVELCGNDARRGAADCAVAGAAQTYPGAEGSAVLELRVTPPPVACPCVIRAREPAGSLDTGGGHLVATVALTVEGVLAGPAEAAPEPATVTVTDLTVTSEPSWQALFGGPASRTVGVTVAHAGELPLVDPPLTLLLGRDDAPTTLVPAPALGTIPAAGQRTYQIPVTLPAPAMGRYTVRGEIGEDAAFLVETTSYPWGLTGALAALVLVAALAMLRSVRRRPR